ncbi:MAG: hypothetical protein HZA14_13170 [Nitrospirae bacterium]|nr:hypothetical protein [Nitrospirota bacterium]
MKKSNQTIKLRAIRNPLVVVGIFRNSAGEMKGNKRLANKRSSESARKMTRKALLDF